MVIYTEKFTDSFLSILQIWPLFLLGGWSSFEMVLRYAHLSSDHLKAAAARVGGTNRALFSHHESNAGYNFGT